jgi:hypothetical protein
MGAILSFAPGERPKRTLPLDIAACLVVLFGLVMQWVVWVHPEVVGHWPAGLVRVLMDVDKEGLHPFRLLSILAITWLTARIVPAGARWLRGRMAAPFVLAGQHSLPVFCAGIFLAFLGRLATEQDSGVLTQIAVNVFGAGSLVVVAAVAAWYSNKGRGAKPAAPRQEAGP